LTLCVYNCTSCLPLTCYKSASLFNHLDLPPTVGRFLQQFGGSLIAKVNG
jgi:hypothetical protein